MSTSGGDRSSDGDSCATRPKRDGVVYAAGVALVEIGQALQLREATEQSISHAALQMSMLAGALSAAAWTYPSEYGPVAAPTSVPPCVSVEEGVTGVTEP